MANVLNGAMIGFAASFYLFSLGVVSVPGAFACYSLIGIASVLILSSLPQVAWTRRD